MRHCFRLLSVALVLAGLALNGGRAGGQDSISYADLVRRMTDLERLAVLPAAGEKCGQWSSYDRASRYDEKTGKYVAWDANGDGNGFIRREGRQFVLAEMQGPGCIWRIWSAAPQQGHVRIFLDGQPEPAVDLPFQKYFSGDTAPFNYPMLSYDLGRLNSSGQNLYFPIPYQKSCKVVADDKWGQYFHFTFDTFPAGTKVPTFSAALAAQNAAALGRINTFLRSRLGTDPAGSRPGEETLSRTVRAAAGQTVRVAELAGPQAVTAVRVRLTFKDREDQMAGLRRLALAITWDGQPKPAVWSPLGDFFGTAPGENHYRTLTTGMTKDGYYAYWYMPFADSAAVDLINEDSQAREVGLEIVHAPLGRPFAGLGHFHAKWHRDQFPLSPDRWPDWVMLRTEGRGRFCGVMLHVWNPRGGWWGEGDEKFFVDGEKFPSTFGTGSEDYFGYAWGNPGLFQRPYHAQTMTQNNTGHQSLLRWHLVDNVPFHTGFEACIEKYFGNADRGTLYACLPVWYLDPRGGDQYGAAPAAQRYGCYVRTPLRAGGFTILGDPPGNVETQQMKGYADSKWTNDQQLWWTGARPGDRLTLTLPVERSGSYRLAVFLTKARDYGIVQFHLDGRKMGPPIDLYHEGVVRTEAISLGTATLEAGQHKLTVEILGANPQAEKGYMFGVDEVRLAPAE
ncbi:MAG: glycoside hydrolase family 172 protein [Thermoguttaceae bacterium]